MRCILICRQRIAFVSSKETKNCWTDSYNTAFVLYKDFSLKGQREIFWTKFSPQYNTKEEEINRPILHKLLCGYAACHGGFLTAGGLLRASPSSCNGSTCTSASYNAGASLRWSVQAGQAQEWGLEMAHPGTATSLHPAQPPLWPHPCTGLTCSSGPPSLCQCMWEDIGIPAGRPGSCTA